MKLLTLSHRVVLNWLLVTFMLFMSSNASAYILARRVPATVYGASINKGDPVTATWSIVRDGAIMPTAFVPNGVPLVNDLVSRLDSLFGVAAGTQTADLTQRPWFPSFEDAMASFTAKTGVTYIYEPNDDGTRVTADGAEGILGVRGDLRLSGIEFRPNTALGYTEPVGVHHPNVIFNTEFNWNATSLRGICMHEVMHTLGFHHSIVGQNAALTTMGYNTNGAQFDDLLGLHHHYGDKYEKSGGNDTRANATDLGSVPAGGIVELGLDAQESDTYATFNVSATDFVSIDNNTDTDFYKFTLNQAQEVSVKVSPRGPDYLWDVSSSFKRFQTVAKELSNLSFRILNTSGNELYRSDSAAIGLPESLQVFLPAGVYYVRVEGSSTQDSDEFNEIPTQFYALEIESLGGAVGPLVAHWKMNESSGTNVSDSSGNGFNATAVNSSQVDGVEGKARNFNGTNARVNLPAAAFNSIDKEITISMWVNGDATQARNDSVFYATDASGARVLNIHLPWSNSNVYWDAGNSGYDRINKVASASQFKGQWNHWVFVKNANVGKMVIYLNGQLFHNGDGNTRSMAGITSATLGSQLSSLYYDGLIDDVRLYNVGLNASSVSDIFSAMSINGVPAKWLVSFGLPLTVASTLADTDGDGLNNLGEYLAGGNPLVQDQSSASPDIRVREYYLTSGDFTGAGASITLDQNLAKDYFILVRGSRSGNGGSMPDNDYARVQKVPGGRGDAIAVSGANSNKRIILSRFAADFDWEGVVTVVECLNPDSPGGFKLVDILTTNLVGSSGIDTSVSWSNLNQVALFGGYRGGGVSFLEEATATSQGTSAYTRIYPTGNNRLNWSRSAGGETLRDAIMTTFVVEWGSEWKVQRVNVVGAAGGNGANGTGEYITANISSVKRANSWVWGTGTRLDAGIGDCAEASLVTLGNGVAQNTNETKVAVGSEYSDGSDFDVYVMTHADLAVDHRFKADGSSGSADLAITVDNAASGARFGWLYNGVNGTGAAFPRSRMWARYTANGTVTISRGYSGQNFPAWVQGIDFSGLNN